MQKRMEEAVPGGSIAMQVAVAGLAAVGLTSLLPGGRESSLLVVAVLTALVAAALVLRTRDTVERVRKAAGRATITDGLTGLATPEAGRRVLELEFAAAQRGRPLTVVLFRVEGLGRYRSEHGGAVANQLLRVAGRTLRKHQRSMHLAARHEGDAGVFVSVLAGVEREGAATYATRVRRELQRPRGVPTPLAVSAGIASFDLSMASPDELLSQAMTALKKGSAGGGKVVVIGG